MSQADIYVAGFLAEKSGASEDDNPYPHSQQPDHATWWCGWRCGKLASDVGHDGAAVVRAEYNSIHGNI
jgi:hypothetical protein